MCKKNEKKCYIERIIGVHHFSATTIVHAEAFAVTVTKAKNGESTKVDKLKNYSQAQATVSSMDVNDTYIMWVEKTSMGTNVTNAKDFNAPKTLTKTYDKPSYVSDSFSARLNISTAITTISTATITGTWTPNY